MPRRDPGPHRRRGPRLLAVDQRLVIPAGAVVKFIVTSNDVIDSFAMPAFWTNTDANPGFLNETWVKVDRPWVDRGQCLEPRGVSPPPSCRSPSKW